MRTRIEQTGLDRLQVGELIDKWIFNQRDREILKRRLLDRIPYKQLEDDFNISERQLKKIVCVGESSLVTKSKLWKL